MSDWETRLIALLRDETRVAVIAEPEPPQDRAFVMVLGLGAVLVIVVGALGWHAAGGLGQW
jgi:hypothetical protein